jgi:hypothetical protein
VQRYRAAVARPSTDDRPPAPHVTGVPMQTKIGVSVAQLVSVYGTLVGVGVFGTRVRDSGVGSFREDATLIAPAVGAFAIWSVIYVGLFVFTVWLWLPGDQAAGRVGPVAGLAAASMLLNATWILVAQAGWVTVSVVVIVALLVVLTRIVQRLGEAPPQTLSERIIVDATFELYLGWVMLATCANVATALVTLGVAATGTAATVVTVGVLVAIAALARWVAGRLPGRWGIALGIGWGLTWIARARSAETPESMPVALTAAVVAGLVAASFAYTADRSTSGSGGRSRPRKEPS